MKLSVPCPECKEIIEGIVWEGGHVVVFEHKGFSHGEKQHHFKLSVEKDQLDGLQNNEEPHRTF